jgi:MerR family transcriptional regulator/heat shock protein HspR
MFFLFYYNTSFFLVCFDFLSVSYFLVRLFIANIRLMWYNLYRFFYCIIMKKKRGYFSISAVASILGVHQQTIRMYEKLGFIHPKRSTGNTRMFSDEDIAFLEIIIYYTTELKVNLAGLEIILQMQNKIDEMQGKINELFLQSKHELSHEKNILEKNASAVGEKIKSLEIYKKK